MAKGSGRVRFESGGIPESPVSWAARIERGPGKTSPEELLAAAHAACFSMALAAQLGRNGTPPRRLSVRATATFDRAGEGWKVTSMELDATGIVPGVEASRFEELARAAKDGCPISQALRGNVELRLTARLASA